MAKMSKGKFKADLHPRGRGGKFIATADKVKEKKYKDPKLQKFAGLSPDKRARLLKLVARKSKTANLQEAPQVTKAPKGRRKATVKITIPTASELATMKVKELEELAAKIGATPPLKYRNRKVSWTEAIEAHRASTATKSKKKTTVVDKTPSDVKPTKEPKVKKAASAKATKKPADKPSTTHTADSLKKLKVSELEAIAKELGAETPAKYKTRKEPWVLSILAKQEAKPSPKSEPVPTKTEPKQAKQAKTVSKPVEPIAVTSTSGNKVTHKELIAVGKHYAEKHQLDTNKDSAVYKAYNLAARNADDSLDAYKRSLKDQSVTPAQRETLKGKAVDAMSKRDTILERIAEREAPVYASLIKDIVTTNAMPIEETRAWLDKLDIKLSGEDAKVARGTIGGLHQLSGGKLNTIKNLKRDRDRAYANAKGDVNIGKGVRKEIIYHEGAHHIEFSHPELHKAAADWRNGRATGKPRLDPSGEERLPDSFLNDYVGRIYRDKRGNYEHTSTEVISMGVQHFTSPKDMVRFRAADPEHFDLIVGILLHKP